MPLVALINRINMGVLLLTICTRHFPLSYEGPQKLTIGVVLWILDIYDSNLFHSNPMSFGYCSPPHLISTIPTSYLNNYLSYEQTDCFHQSYELIWTIPDTLLIYEFWRHFNHVSLCHSSILELWHRECVYMIPQNFYLIPQDTYWYPEAPIDTPGHLLIPHPVVLFPQGPVAPAILIQIRWFLYCWKAKNQIYKMASFVC